MSKELNSTCSSKLLAPLASLTLGCGGGRGAPPSLWVLQLQFGRIWPLRPQRKHSFSRPCPFPLPFWTLTATRFPSRFSNRRRSPSSLVKVSSSEVSGIGSWDSSSRFEQFIGAGPLVRRNWTEWRCSLSWVYETHLVVCLRISSASELGISLKRTLIRILSGNWIPWRSRCLRSSSSQRSMAAPMPAVVLARSLSGLVSSWSSINSVPKPMGSYSQLRRRHCSKT